MSQSVPTSWRTQPTDGATAINDTLLNLHNSDEEKNSWENSCTLTVKSSKKDEGQWLMTN